MKNTDFAEVVWLLYYFFFNRIHCRSLGTGDDFQHWNPHSYSERPRMEKKRNVLSIRRGLSCRNTGSLTAVNSG